jgi:deoxyribodipyrimidine photo-lyase
MTKQRTGLYIFHKALRLTDNLGLIEALKTMHKVIPVFIFTPEQLTNKNKFKSVPSIRFMLNALKDLDQCLKKHKSKLHMFYGEPSKVLLDLLTNDITDVFINMDFTPYAKNREESMRKVCEKRGVTLHSIDDYLMLPINSVTTGSGSYYKVYTPYYRKALKVSVQKPKRNSYKNYAKKAYKNQVTINKIAKQLDVSLMDVPNFIASRKEGKKRVNAIKNMGTYNDDRDKLTFTTTRLSPYIKFGIVSAREVYHKIVKEFNKNHSLVAQLIWRDFYYNVVHNAPRVLKGKSFREKYDKIKWKTDTKLLNKWKKGMTGYPLVDAGMRQLNSEYYMHNRARLVTSSFLVKFLLIDWREGEKYFATQLVDYDPAVNNGNWQFISGTGSSVQQYTRFMNPSTQSAKFDPDCEYIKKWIPELKDVPNKDIHEWHIKHTEHKTKYPSPCIKYDFKKIKNAIVKKYTGKSKYK